MEAWQERVVEEQKELHERLCKLRKFIEDGKIFELDGENKALLLWQYSAMEAYHAAIMNRIHLFDKEYGV